MEIYEAPEIYESIVWSDDVGYTNIKVVVSTFKDTEYLHIRKYYLDFDEEWKPTKDGITIPLDIDNTKAIFRALAEIISLAEAREVIEEYFGDIIRDIYK
jgi:hypothetical protein